MHRERDVCVFSAGEKSEIPAKTSVVALNESKERFMESFVGRKGKGETL